MELFLKKHPLFKFNAGNNYNGNCNDENADRTQIISKCSKISMNQLLIIISLNRYCTNYSQSKLIILYTYQQRTTMNIYLAY